MSAGRLAVYRWTALALAGTLLLAPPSSAAPTAAAKPGVRGKNRSSSDRPRPDARSNGPAKPEPAAEPDQRGGEKPSESLSPEAIIDPIRAAIGDPAVQVRLLGRSVLLEGTVAGDAEKQRVEAIVQALAPDLKLVNLLQTQAAETVARLLNETLARTGARARVLSPSTVVVEGAVTPAAAEQVRKIMEAVEPKVTLLDALQAEVEAPQQVLIRARIVDINRSRLKELGVDYGQVVPVAGGRTVVDQPFLFGLSGQPFRRDPFSGGIDVNPLDPIGARLRLLVQQNAARILSEPNLLVLEGAEASLLVGGEFPIPSVRGITAVGIATAVTVEFKEFGVRLQVKPLQVAEGQITLQVTPEVSVLDFANGVQVSGFSLPALRTRREQSTVRIANGQTLAIGGLFQESMVRELRRIPLLSEIPILGELFKQRSHQRIETELVILLTPQIVSAGISPTLPPLPQAPRPESEPPTGSGRR